MKANLTESSLKTNGFNQVTTLKRSDRLVILWMQQNSTCLWANEVQQTKPEGYRDIAVLSRM